MAYIGTSPSNGVRRVHTYTATANQTTFTGSSTEGVTLTYADTNYIDVFQNGVLLGSADYTSTSGTSVVLAQGASVSDLVVIVVYDVFSVADTVSKTAGGSFDSAVTMSGGLRVADGGNIGSASDTDAIAIASNGVVTFSQKTVGAGGMDLLLDDTSADTSSSIYDIDSTIINSTYDDYFVIFAFDPDADNHEMNFRVFVGGTIQTGSIYGNEVAAISSSTYFNNNAFGSPKFNVTNMGNAAGEGISGHFFMHNVNSTTHPFNLMGQSTQYNTSGLPNSNHFAVHLIPANRANVVNGIRLFPSGGDLAGSVKVYGIRT